MKTNIFSLRCFTITGWCDRLLVPTFFFCRIFVSIFIYSWVGRFIKPVHKDWDTLILDIPQSLADLLLYFIFVSVSNLSVIRRRTRKLIFDSLSSFMIGWPHLLFAWVSVITMIKWCTRKLRDFSQLSYNHLIVYYTVALFLASASNLSVIRRRTTKLICFFQIFYNRWLIPSFNVSDYIFLWVIFFSVAYSSRRLTVTFRTVLCIPTTTSSISLGYSRRIQWRLSSTSTTTYHQQPPTTTPAATTGTAYHRPPLRLLSRFTPARKLQPFTIRQPFVC